MVKKKDPYSRIQDRFVESRLEERGWDEMDMDARERVSSRFNMLSQSIEGRGKIARQILGTESSPEQRKALKQRLRKNLPSKSGTGTQATDLNPTGPATSAVFAGRYGSPTTGRVNQRPTTTVQPRTPATSKPVTGEFGSTYTPSSFANFAAETKIPVLGDFVGTGIPVLRVIRQGAKELDEAAMAFKQGEIKEGLKNVAGVGRELAFGAFDAALLRSGGYAAVKTAPKIASKIASSKFLGKPIVGAAKAIDNAALGGLGQALKGKFSRGKVSAVNETPPVASTVTQVVQTPVTQTAATTATTATTGTKTRRTSSTKTKTKKTDTPVVQSQVQSRVAPQVAVNTPSSPAKAPEIVQPNPVTPPTMQPPTQLQKTVTPEQFTQPVAPPASQPVTAPKAPVEIAGPSTPKPKGTKKGGKKKATSKTEEGVKIEVIKPVQGTPPATGEVVGGAAPKAPQGASATPSLPTLSTTPVRKATGKSGKSPSGSTQSPIPTSSVIQPGNNPPVVAGQATAIPKQSGRDQVFKQPEIVSQTSYSDPTGWSKTGTVKKTVYKSQAVEQTERALKPKAVPKNTAREQATIELIEGAPGPLMPVPKKQAAKIEFVEKIEGGEKFAYPTPEGRKIQDQQLVMNDPRSKAEQSYVNARAKQLEEYADAANQQRWELSPRRKTQRELRQEMQGEKGKSLMDVARDLQKDEKRRPASQRRNLKNRRKPLSDIDPQVRKELKRMENPDANPNLYVEQNNKGYERVISGTAEEAAIRDPRTIEQIRKSRELEMQFQNSLFEPKTKMSRKEKNARKRAAEKRDRLIGSQRDPEVIRQEKVERLEKQRRMENRAQRMDRVDRASTRNRIRMEQRAETRRGIVPQDDSPGLRQTVTFEDADMNKPQTSEFVSVDQFMTQPRQTRVEFDDSVFNRPAYGPNLPPPLPGSTELPYVQKFGPAQMTYEELLKVEATKAYAFKTSKSPFTRRTASGTFVLQEGKSGALTMDSMRSTNVTPEELRRLIKSTTKKADE